MTDRPKLDAAAIEEFCRKLLAYSSAQYSWIGADEVHAICDLALQALDTREVRAKALEDAAAVIRRDWAIKKLADINTLDDYIQSHAAAIRRGE